MSGDGATEQARKSSPDPAADDAAAAARAAAADRSVAAARAAAAEDAVVARHVRPLWRIPGTALGVVGWPPSTGERRFVRWHYWWQAHLLDCLIDAELRAPDVTRRVRITAVTRTHRIRNARRWINGYFDDMAWLGLALERAERYGIAAEPAAVRVLADQLLGAWVEPGGGIPWRKRDSFRNAPANGPAAVLLARLGHRDRARQTLDWIYRELLDPDTGLIFDGVSVEGRIERALYTYCQGVVLGTQTELALACTAEQSARLQTQAVQLVRAVDRHLTVGGVIHGRGGGNGGLFSGILARYLALVANELPDTTPDGVEARGSSRRIVAVSAAAAWEYRATVDGRPLFGPEWTEPVIVPRSNRPGRFRSDGAESSDEPQRDLSVQLSGWMLLEAAATLRPPD